MSKIVIKSSEPLFNKWKEIGSRIRKVANLMDDSCAALVQNDIEVKLENLLRWKEIVVPGLLEELDTRKTEIIKLAEITRNYIKASNE